MARTLAAIDRDLDVERAIWIMERRGGRCRPEALDSMAKLDQLLEERTAATRAAPVSSP